MEQIWRLVAEIVVEPGDMRDNITNGFINVTTWAVSADAAIAKFTQYIGKFNWQVVEIEKSEVITDDDALSDELADMVIRTRANPNAIILGTFHGYKVN